MSGPWEKFQSGPWEKFQTTQIEAQPEETISPEDAAAIASQKFPGERPLAGRYNTGQGFYRNITTPLKEISPESLLSFAGVPQPAARAAVAGLEAGSQAPGAVGAVSSLASGTLQGAGDIASSVTSPIGIVTLPLMAAKAVPAAVKGIASLGFSADMLRHVPESYEGVKQAAEAGDATGVVRGVAGLGGALGFGIGAGRHGMRTLRNLPAKKSAIRPDKNYDDLPESKKAVLMLEAETQSTRFERIQRLSTEGRAEGPTAEAPLVTPEPPLRKRPAQAEPVVIGEEARPVEGQIIGAEKVSEQTAARDATLSEISDLQNQFNEAFKRDDGPAMVDIQNRIIDLGQRLGPEAPREIPPVGIEDMGNLRTQAEIQAGRTTGPTPPEFVESPKAPLSGRVPSPKESGLPEATDLSKVSAIAPESLVADDLWAKQIKDIPPEDVPPTRPTQEQMLKNWVENNKKNMPGRDPVELTNIQRPTQEQLLQKWVENNRKGMGTREAQSAFEAALRRWDQNLEKAKIKGGRLNVMGLPELVWNGSLNAAQLVLRSGKSLSEAVGEATRWIKTNYPNLKFDEGQFAKEIIGRVRGGQKFKLPDLTDREQRKANIKPFGLGEIPGIGKLFDPQANVRNPTHRSILTWAEEKSIGDAIVSAVSQQISGLWDRFMEKNERGEVTNIRARDPKASLFKTDVMETAMNELETTGKVTSYDMTPDQIGVVREWIDLNKEIIKLEDRNGMVFDPIVGDYVSGKSTRKTGGYFPRIVTKFPPKSQAALSGGNQGTKVGGVPGYAKDRPFISERIGVEKGYQYEQSLEKAATTRLQKLYRAIADKRLADDPDLQGRSRASYKSQLMEAYAEEIGSGRITEAAIEKMVSDVSKNQGVPGQPAFFGKIYDIEIATELRRHFPNMDSTFRKVWVEAGDLLKGLKLGFDLGAGFIQGQTTLFNVKKNGPAVWAKAQGKSFMSLLDKDVFPEYARENIDYVRELAEQGSSIGRLPEMLAGLERGHWLDKADLSKVFPGLGKAGKLVPETAQAFARTFQTFLDVAKIELWKSQRELVPKSEWKNLAQQIESDLSLGRMESIGITSRRALLERAFFLAPSYYRGALNNVAHAIMNRKTTGNMAATSLASQLAGGAALFVGAAVLAGMSKDEIMARFNPTRSDYMMVSWKDDDGKTKNFGLGGIHRSLLRLLATVMSTTANDPKKMLSPSPRTNPLLKWYRGHAAPIPSLGMDALVEEDYLGRPVTLGTMAASSLPLPVQKMIESVAPREGEPKAGVPENISAFVGVSSFPLSDRKEKAQARDEVSQSLFSKKYDDLNIGQMLQVSSKISQDPRFAVDEPSTLREIASAQKIGIEQEKRLNRKIKARDQLEDLGLRVTGYKPSFTLRGLEVSVTGENAERLEEITLEEYDRMMSPGVLEKLSNVPIQRRQEILNKLLTRSREVARARLFQEIGSK